MAHYPHTRRPTTHQVLGWQTGLWPAGDQQGVGNPGWEGAGSTFGIRVQAPAWCHQEQHHQAHKSPEERPGVLLLPRGVPSVATAGQPDIPHLTSTCCVPGPGYLAPHGTKMSKELMDQKGTRENGSLVHTPWRFLLFKETLLQIIV